MLINKCFAFFFFRILYNVFWSLQALLLLILDPLPSHFPILSFCFYLRTYQLQYRLTYFWCGSFHWSMADLPNATTLKMSDSLFLVATVQDPNLGTLMRVFAFHARNGLSWFFVGHHNCYEFMNPSVTLCLLQYPFALDLCLFYLVFTRPVLQWTQSLGEIV